MTRLDLLRGDQEPEGDFVMDARLAGFGVQGRDGVNRRIRPTARTGRR